MAAFTAIALASAAYGVYNQVKAGGAERDAGNAEQAAANDRARLINWNAKVADLQAQDAITRGQEEEQRIRMGLRQIIGSQRASRAASNVDISVGSAVDIQADAARLAELDVLTTRNNAAREAWGYNVEAQDLRMQAEITRREGANAAKAGRVRAGQQYRNAFSTVLSTGATFLQGKYGGGNKPKPTAYEGMTQ